MYKYTYTFLSRRKFIMPELLTVTDYYWTLLPVREINLKACANNLDPRYLTHLGVELRSHLQLAYTTSSDRHRCM